MLSSDVARIGSLSPHHADVHVLVLVMTTVCVLVDTVHVLVMSAVHVAFVYTMEPHLMDTPQWWTLVI